MRLLRNHRLSFALALVAMATTYACGGGSASPTTPAPVTSGGGGSTSSTADVTITITGMNGSQSYSPSPATVKAGQTVSWKNGDSITHTATADGGGFDTGAIGPGSVSAPIKMSSAGSFAYHCAIHPSMKGSLVVQ
jgi:plastocyanin